MSLSPADLASKIDHTLLKATASQSEIEKLCQEAKHHKFFSVCVAPARVELARDFLSGSLVKVCSVVGFPLGNQTTTIKVKETEELVKFGVHEIDMVINIGRLKDGDDLYVVEEIEQVMRAAGICPVKVIIETAHLTPDEIVRACEAIVKAGAAFVKTSTGFAPAGAEISDIQLIRKTVGGLMGVKASGGIKDLKTAVAMIEAGATRLGCSASVEIIQEASQ